MPQCRFVVAGMGLVVVFLVLVACSLGSATAQNAATPTPVLHAKVGEVVQLPGEWSITVENLRTMQGVGYDPKPPGGETYLLITVTMKNLSTGQQLANSADYALRDAQGDTEPTALLLSSPNFSGNLTTGEQIRGTLNFTVPRSVHQFTLSYTPAAIYPLTTLAEWDVTT